MAFSPLGHGWLVDDFNFNSPDDFAPDDFRRTGTYDSGAQSERGLTGADVMMIVPKFQGENFYHNKAIVDEIKKLAARKNCTVAQVALAWVVAQGLIPIPGTTKASRLQENWGSRDVILTEEELGEMRRIVDDAKPVGERFNAAFESMAGH